MDSRRWMHARDVFERSLDLPPQERVAFVERETNDDLEVAREVRRLLANCGDSTAFLRPLDAREVGSRLVEALLPVGGDRIGAYRIERVLGSGGMGTVYLAQQDRPARKVALKVMRAGLGSSEAQRRFQVEAEILGALRHPAIAAIYELGLGEGPAGTPFFAMEFVDDARDLATYAREKGLGVRARIELFREVCAAVAHAHRRGVIHRDLKPGNVLVDAAGHPKVIDFGVARVTEPDAVRGSATLGQRVFGTLQYASPEQISGDPRDVDVRTDVHALGAILYELLAGRPAVEAQQRPIDEIVAEIVQHMPAPPSRCAPDLGAELDWIVLKCLRKERDERYGSAEELSADLGRYLRNEPVSAGPPTARYRLRKFVARNRVAVAAGALVLASLVAGMVSTGLALVEAKQQTRRAESALRRQTAAISSIGGLFQALAPDADGTQVTVAELLERKRSSLDSGVSDDPLVRAALEEFLATGYYHLGLVEPAAQLAESALLTVEREPEAERSLVTRLRILVGTLWTRQGRFDDSREVLEACVRDLEQQGELRTAEGVSALVQLAELRNWLGHRELAVEAYRQVVPMSEEVLGPDDPTTIMASSKLAFHLARLAGSEDEAERWARRAHERASSALSPEHPLVLSTTADLAEVLQSLGKRDEALALQRQVIERMVERYGETHFNTLAALQALARWLVLAKQLDEAEQVARRTVELTAQSGAGDPHMECDARITLALVLDARGETEEQAGITYDAVRVLDDAGLSRDPDMVILRVRLAKLELARGRPQQAEELARGALELGRELYPDDNVMVVVSRARLARALLALERFEEAEREFLASHAQASLSSDRQTNAIDRDCLQGLVELYTRQGRDADRARMQALLDTPAR